jgi:hypothetical protein|eukprot:SAG25_NODE_118_length_14760_cov_873.663666_9_plen_74_part_00
MFVLLMESRRENSSVGASLALALNAAACLCVRVGVGLAAGARTLAGGGAGARRASPLAATTGTWTSAGWEQRF